MKAPLLLLGAFLLIGAAAQERYVPAGIWRTEGADAHFEQWFGGQLRAMDEPILSRAGALGNYRQRFRLLVLPPSSPAYAIRIDESDAGGRVRVVWLDGRNGDAPGRVAGRYSYALGPNEMREVNRALSISGLATAPAEGSPETICGDATHFVLELLDARGARFVTRSQCDISPALLDLVNTIRSLLREQRG